MAAELEFEAYAESLGFDLATLTDTQRHGLEGEWRDANRRQELADLRASRPVLDFRPPGGGRPAAGEVVLQAAALCLFGRDEVAAKALGADAAQQGRDMRIRTALDLCEATLRAAGVTPPRGKNELVRAAFELQASAGGSPSTYSLPTLLGSSANTMIVAAYTEAPQTWRPIADIRSAANFHTQTGIRLSGMPGLERVAKGGEIRHGTLSEGTYTWQVDTYARLLGIDRRDIVNDSLGAFADNSVAFGRAAARSVNNLVWALWANNSAHFTVGRGNIQSGGGSVLSASSLSTALANMAKQTDGDGNPLDLAGRFLIVPPELRETAIALLESDAIQLASTATGPTGNVFQGALSLVVEPRLSTTSYTGSSTTAWYVTAAPSDGALVVGFLDNKQTPTIEYFGFDSDPSMLTALWRCYMDYGCAFGDYKAAQKSAGA